MAVPTLHLLINPAAGRGRAGRRLARILALFQQAGLRPQVHVSTETGDLEEQARALAADAGNAIIAAGGDGTVHEVVNGILAAKTRTAFGVVPVGTGNDFAKAAGVPLHWETAVQLLADRITSETPPRRVDAGRINDRYFSNGAGIGFDAVVTRIARSYAWRIGDLVYLFAIFRAMAPGVASPRMTIRRRDEVLWDGPLTLANTANGAWLGGMFHIAPDAHAADGELNLVVAGPVTRRRILALLPKLVRGTHVEEDDVVQWAVSRVSITADAPVESHLDGEVQPPQSSFEIEVLPGALRLL